MSETLYNPSSSGYASDGQGWSTGTSTVVQGSSGSYSNYYGVMYFDFASFRSTGVSYKPTQIRVVLKSHVGYARTVRLYIGKGMAKDTYTWGARPSAVAGTSYVEASCGANASCQFTITDTAWLSALLDSGTTCLFINRGDSTSSYWEGDGASTANKPQLYVTWVAREPKPTAPALGTIPTVISANPTFQWTAGTDANGLYSPSQFTYEMQLSLDNGQTWPAESTCFTSTQGSTQFAFNSPNGDLKSVLGLQSTQYYCNPNVRIRVRTKAIYNGSAYYSSYALSAAFTVDYRIVPSAPSTFSIRKNGVAVSSAFEGEALQFILGRPNNYNAQDSSGNTMVATYSVELSDGTLLSSAVSNLSVSPLTVPTTGCYAVGNLTGGTSNLVAAIRARCVDGAGEIGAYTAGTTFAVNRFRLPAATIAGVTRYGDGSATVRVLVTDTGYGGVQSNSQISLIRYKLDDGAYVTAFPGNGTWGDSSNTMVYTFTIPSQSLTNTQRYTLTVKPANTAPAGTSLATKEGCEYSAVMLEYVPSLMVWRDSSPYTHAPTGSATQALIVGNDFAAVVDAGCIAVNNNIAAGGAISSYGQAVLNADGNYVVRDTRSTATSTDMGNAGVRFEVKANATDGLSDGGIYHGIITFQQWSDNAGGTTHQLGMTDNGNLYIRTATIGGTWGAWKELTTTDASGNLTVTGTLAASAALAVGGTLTANGTLDVNGTIIVDSDTYGSTLPAAGAAGRIFFKTA